MPLIDPAPPGKGAPVALGVAALLLTLIGLYLWPWWPSGFSDPTFLEFRREFTDGPRP